MSEYAKGAEAMRAAIADRLNELINEWKTLRDGYDPKGQWEDRQVAEREIEGYKTAIGVLVGVALEDPSYLSPAIDLGLPYNDPPDRPVYIPGRFDAGVREEIIDAHYCAGCGRFFKNFGNACSMPDGSGRERNMHKRCCEAFTRGVSSRAEWWEALHATYFALFSKQAPESMKACDISHAIVDSYRDMETIARSPRGGVSPAPQEKK